MDGVFLVSQIRLYPRFRDFHFPLVVVIWIRYSPRTRAMITSQSLFLDVVIAKVKAVLMYVW